MDRTISLAFLLSAMIAVTPAVAQAPETSDAPSNAATASVVDAALADNDAQKPRTVRIAGRTVAVDSLPSSDDAKPAAPPTKPKARARR